jgi:hypothetical protein
LKVRKKAEKEWMWGGGERENEKVIKYRYPGII